MYGIPNMKLSKKTVDRRVLCWDLLEEGIEFADIGASSSDGGVDIEKLGESNQKRLLVSREGNLESNYATSSLRPERTSWSLAVETPERTASARRCATAAKASSTLRCSPSRPLPGPKTIPGRSGPGPTGWITATRRFRRCSGRTPGSTRWSRKNLWATKTETSRALSPRKLR